MKKVISLQVGQLTSNCFIYKISKTKAIVIDPGDDAEYIIQKLLDNNLTPSLILATHGHFDHIMAGFTLQAAYNTPFYSDPEDEFLVERMRPTAIHFGEVDPGPQPIINAKLKDIESTFQIIKTPGHTPGSVSYFDPKEKIVFVGDLLFSDGTIGEVTHKYSSRIDLKKSIKKIVTLPPDTIVFSGHGESSSVSDLKEIFRWALL